MSAFSTLLKQHGIRTRRWHRNRNMHEFARGTMEGVGHFDEPHFRVVAIINNQRGNGDFVALIDAFQKCAVESRRSFQLVELWNKRLAEWFRARGYAVTTSENLGLHATYNPDRLT